MIKYQIAIIVLLSSCQKQENFQGYSDFVTVADIVGYFAEDDYKSIELVDSINIYVKGYIDTSSFSTYIKEAEMNSITHFFEVKDRRNNSEVNVAVYSPHDSLLFNNIINKTNSLKNNETVCIKGYINILHKSTPIIPFTKPNTDIQKFIYSENCIN